MKTSQAFGVVVFAVGVVLLGFVYRSSIGPLDELATTLAPQVSNLTMWPLAVGIAAILAGGILAVFDRRTS